MLIFKNRIVLTLYPSHEQRGNEIVKTSEKPDNPIIIVQEQDESGKVLSQKYLSQGKEITIGDGSVGPLSAKLFDELMGIQYGRAEDPFDWVLPVTT